MADLTVSEPYCSSDDNSTYTDCGSETYAYLLLMSWNIISMYIFVNMFVSLIIGNFSYVYRSGGSRSGINRSEIKNTLKLGPNLILMELASLSCPTSQE